jgi:hydrogenase maturation protease
VIRIIGIGAPFGDDAAGLEVARRLAATTLPECDVVAADRPGARLLDLLDGMEAVILVDAVCSGAPPGTVHQLTFAELVRDCGRFVSSHELGVGASLELARKLGRAPAHGGMLGIEVDPRSARTPYSRLSPAVRRAVSEVLVRLQHWVEELKLHRYFSSFCRR